MSADSSRTQLPPGPRLPGPLQTIRYTFDQPGSFAAYRARFGPTFTLKMPGFPPIVVTADRDAIRDLFTGDPLTKRHGNDLLRPFLGDRSLIVLEPAEHLSRRRLELPSFHGERVRAYVDRIRELAVAEVEGWLAGDIVEVHPRARQLTLAVILELVLGVRDARLGLQIARHFDSFNSRVNNLAQFVPWMARKSWWNLPARFTYSRIDRVRGLLEAHIGRTRADPELERREDVLALLVRARDQNGATLDDSDLRDELMTLVTAGHETTATAIAWAADLLAHNPAVADRLRETLSGDDREYLKATAKEVLRARTVAYASAARHSLKPLKLGDWVIGAETLVLVDAQGIHGDPDLYPEPERFRPERFLGGGQPDGYSYVPFGGGAHRCLGASLATMELELAIEAMVTRVRLVPVGPPARPVRRGVTLAPGNAGRVRVADLIVQ